MIAHIFKGIGRKVGMTSTDGIVIDERARHQGRRLRVRSSARMVLQNPRVDFAVMEVARGGILREGLGYDRNDVAVVTNVAPDHLGMQRHRHPRPAGRRQGRHRRGGAARRLRGAQRRRRHCAQHASALLGRRRLVLDASPAARCASSSTTTAVAAAVPSCSSRADRGDMIVIKHGRRSMQLAWTHLLPSTFGGAARFNVANALAAAAARRSPPAPRCTTSARGCGRSRRRYYLLPRPHEPRRASATSTSFVDYCHNAARHAELGDFVGAYAAQKAGPVRPRARPRASA